MYIINNVPVRSPLCIFESHASVFPEFTYHNLPTTFIVLHWLNIIHCRFGLRGIKESYGEVVRRESLFTVLAQCVTVQRLDASVRDMHPQG